jgi:hypothetical protein
MASMLLAMRTECVKLLWNFHCYLPRNFGLPLRFFKKLTLCDQDLTLAPNYLMGVKIALAASSRAVTKNDQGRATINRTCNEGTVMPEKPAHLVNPSDEYHLKVN